jgi:uncharacterized protein YyaL (SSP411 family)
VANAEMLLTELRRPDGRWLRSWQSEAGARHLGLAADYGALVGAFIALAQATGQARWIDEAVTTADGLLDLFWDPVNGGVFTTGEDADALVVRQKDLLDNATPSANSLAADSLTRLAALTGESRYQNHADQVLSLLGAVAGQAPSAFSNMLAVVDLSRAGVTEIAVAGNRPDLVAEVQRRYLPNAVLTWGERYDSPLWEGRDDGRAYVCHGYVCQAPVDTAGALGAQLDAIPGI